MPVTDRQTTLAARLGVTVHVSPLRDAVLPWSRLAEPVMANGRCNAESWRLVA
jgi:hypothetical protein